MKQPRLLFYVPALGDGGAERLWAALASHFCRTGLDVHFAQDFEAGENRAHLDPRIPIYTLGRSHLQSVRRLSRLIRDLRPDIALSAVAGSNLKLMAALGMARCGTQAILSYHGSQEYRTGKLSYATFRLLPILSRRAARTIAVSHGLRERLITTWGADPTRTMTIHNPVVFPAHFAVPTPEDLQRRAAVVLSVGRLAPEKDFVTLVRAFARLNRTDARLVIVGKGPQHEAIIAEAARLGVSDRVELPGFLAEPWDAYRQARVFVSSSMSEEFGNAIVEALAFGLPVIATACSGPREILEDGRHGTIVAIGDVDALTHAIDDALKAPGDPAARRRRADDFSFVSRVGAYEALIDDVLGGGRRRGGVPIATLAVSNPKGE